MFGGLNENVLCNNACFAGMQSIFCDFAYIVWNVKYILLILCS